VKEVRFEAAHRLPSHAGKCARPHGHSYRAELWFEGQVTEDAGASEDGMVFDFGKVSDYWKTQLEPDLDHHDLNEEMPVAYHPTTAEHVAAYLFDRLAGAGFPVTMVRVWETATGSAVYVGEGG